MTSRADSTDTSQERGEQLPLAVAVELATALASASADKVSARILVIKGRVASHYELRSERTSADTDILVEPTRHQDVVAALTAWGWRERPILAVSAQTNPHSASLMHDGWPCDIDVHAYFPGFLAPSDVTFDALWAEREHLEFAGINCPTPGLHGAVLIAALHGIRPSATPGRGASELRELGEVLDRMDQQERDRLVELAWATGSAGPLAPYLAGHAMHLDVANTPGLRAWNVLVAGGSTHAGVLASATVGKPLRVKLHILRIAAWPSADDLRATYPGVADNSVARTWARVKRVGRGVRQVPAAVYALAKSRRTTQEARDDDAD